MPDSDSARRNRRRRRGAPERSTRSPRSDRTQTNPSPAKQIQAKLLGFVWFYSSESGLFNGLRRFQIKNLVPSNALRQMSQRHFHSLFGGLGGSQRRGPANGKRIAWISVFCKTERTIQNARPSAARALRIAAFWLALWVTPTIAIAPDCRNRRRFHIDRRILQQDGARDIRRRVCGARLCRATGGRSPIHWVTPGEMLDGLGMAETTPGPLIMVLQFVGFMAAFRASGYCSRRLVAGASRRPARDLGDVHALLPLDIRRRALHRASARQQASIAARYRRSRRPWSASCSTSRSGSPSTRCFA